MLDVETATVDLCFAPTLCWIGRSILVMLANALAPVAVVISFVVIVSSIASPAMFKAVHLDILFSRRYCWRPPAHCAGCRHLHRQELPQAVPLHQVL